jgi:hypothetical protein
LLIPAAAGALAWGTPPFSLAPSDIAAAASDVKGSGSDDAVILYEAWSIAGDTLSVSWAQWLRRTR